MKTTKLNFVNQDGIELSAQMEFPIDQHPTAYVIFAHCFTCHKNLTAVRRISRAMAMRGLAVLRFDFTGLGDSQGSFSNTSFSSNVADIIAAANFLEQSYRAPSLLVGHSLGGAACLMAASKLKSIKGVATIGSPADPKHVTHLLDEAKTEILDEGTATVTIGGRKIEIGKKLLEDLDNQELVSTIKTMRKALLIMHSPQDEIVGIDNAQTIYLAAHHPKSFISLDGADHILNNKEDSKYVGEVISAWASRYLSKSGEKQLNTDMQVLVSLQPEDKFTSLIKAGLHSLTADEPESVGGNDYGPSPYEFVSAGLGACTAMTLKMYADRKKWELGEIKVHVSHGKVHADDCNDCVEESSESVQKIDQLERRIEFENTISEEQSKKLLEIADKCPVHKTLESIARIKTQIKYQKI